MSNDISTPEIHDIILGSMFGHALKEVARLQLASEDAEGEAAEGLLAKAHFFKAFLRQALPRYSVRNPQAVWAKSLDDLIALAKEDLIDGFQLNAYQSAGDEAVAPPEEETPKKNRHEMYADLTMRTLAAAGATIVDFDEDPSPLMNLKGCFVVVLPKEV